MTQSEALELFDYKDGILYWKKKAHKTGPDYTGCIAGCVNMHGRTIVKVNRKTWLVHRIIFLMFNGYLPEFIDHADRNKLNNRIDNLRDATYSQNNANRSVQKNNKCGLKGIYKRKNRNVWVVRVGVGIKRKYIGGYQTKEEAHEVYKREVVKIYGEFANV